MARFPFSAPNTATESVSVKPLLAVLVGAMLLVPISSDVPSLLLPAISEEFTALESQAAWAVTGFLLACAICIPLFGKATDRFNLGSLMCGALVVFSAGSATAALAPELWVLVAGRALAGAGGAAIPVVAVLAAGRMLPPAQAASGIGLIAGAGGVGAALGPALGGFIGDAWGWTAPFWVMSAWALLLIIPAWRTLGSERSSGTGGTDLVGAALIGASAGLLLFGVTQADTPSGLASPASWLPLLGGAVSVALFIWRIHVATTPFVAPSLFRVPGFTPAVLVIFLAMFANVAMLVLIPLIIVGEHGLTPASGALVMIPGGIALAVSAPLTGRLSRRIEPRTLTIIGLALIATAALWMSTFVSVRDPWAAAVAVTVLGAGFAVVVTTTTAHVSAVLPQGSAGGGMGIFQGAQFLGAGAGPACMAVVASLRHDQAAFNPAAAGEPSGFSDALLLLTVVTAIALAFASRLTTPDPAHRK